MAILRRDRGVGDRWRFAGIELAEPAKPDLLAWQPDDAVPRQARVTCWNRDDGRAYTGTVSLTGDQVTAFEHRPGVQPNATVSEWHEADAMLRQEPGIIAALASRGITDLSLVMFDTWTYGYALIPEQYRDRRVGWVDVAAGEPYDIPRAICVHEEDNGVLWKHVDPEAGAEVRRMRRLVISFHATVANYEYPVYWRFYPDGNIECEVRATGIMVVTHLPAGQQAPGTLVDERTYAPFHQHFIVARLDLDIDGTANSVYCCDSEGLPIGAGNPLGLTLVQRQTPLRTEADGRQDYRWDTQRSWKIASESTRNRLGTPTGYKLVPGGCFPPMMDPASPVFRRAEVIGHTLWVTPYQPDERWPCGEFCNQSERDDGLPAWTAQNRPIAGTDVVLWYVFGIHHITRPEDWPVMPATRCRSG